MSHGQGPYAQQPASSGQGGGGLVETPSLKPSDAIKADHIITCGELELNVPIGVGAEGKVGMCHYCRRTGWLWKQPRHGVSAYMCN